MRFIFILLLIRIGSFAWGQEPRSALDNTPSVETAAVPVPASAVTPVASVPTVQEPAPEKGQSSYVYDLKKLIIQSRENIKRVNAKIKEQAVIKRNQKREERAREYYQRGIQLTDEGKLDEAREYFEKAVNITEHPEMTGYIKESERRLKLQEQAIKHEEVQRLKQVQQDDRFKQEDAQNAYREAVALYKEKKYKAAKDQFEHVDALVPDYKAVRSYLRILDQDIIQQEALNIKQQKVEIERQNKEAEAARAREKEVWRKEVDRKEKERKTQVNEQADKVYNEAVALYKDRKFAAAKEKFQEVEWVVPDYKAERNYLKNIDKDIAGEEKRMAAQKEKDLEKQKWEEEVARKKEETQRKALEAQKEKEHRRQLEDEAQFVYQAALTLFNKGILDEALEKFNDVEKTAPGFKSVRVYIVKTAQAAARQARQKVIADEKTKRDAEEAQRRQLAQDKTAKEKKEGEMKEAKTIEELAQRSAALYKQISALTDDRYTVTAKRKLSKVEDVLNNLKVQKEHLLRQMREEEERAHRARAAQMYDEGIVALRNRDFDGAKAKFLELENTLPDYKATRSYLRHIEQDKERAGQQAVLERTRAEEARAKELEEQQRREEAARAAAEEERKRQLRQAQEEEVRGLAEKASILNDDILKLSKEHKFDEAKAKFEELEKVVVSLKATKQAMESDQAKEQETKKQAQENTLRLKETRKAAQEKEQAHQRKLINALEAQKKEMENQRRQERSGPKEELTPKERQRKKYLEREEQRKQEMERRRQEAERLERERQERLKKIDGSRKQKKKAEAKAREDAGSKAELDAQADQMRKKLEAERAVLRKQLEDRVEAIYQEAVGLYKAGKYTEAGKKFNDVQDIIPDYKRSKDLMKKSIQLSVKSQKNIPVAVPQPVLHGVSRNKAVEGALDRFESNVR
ncbi:MAG: hypothetical protein HYZ86_01590 [Candidatus Omnitrophica bacterium]|nr:hypothetical protein [Candidatus Omnitrophota bacterium]